MGRILFLSAAVSLGLGVVPSQAGGHRGGFGFAGGSPFGGVQSQSFSDSVVSYEEHSFSIPARSFSSFSSSRSFGSGGGGFGGGGFGARSGSFSSFGGGPVVKIRIGHRNRIRAALRGLRTGF